jgi:REP element-mobilizing transposase RayT
MNTRDKNGQRRGGARGGAGRPCTHDRPSERHKKRLVFSRRAPVHVITRVVPRIGTLRRRQLYACIRYATITLAKHESVRIVHLSIQRGHLHLIVEATGNIALAKGMQSFLISAAKLINRAIGGRGCVFRDRYHPTMLTTPRQVRSCIAYVLNNWRRHGEDVGHRWKIDPYSSAILFSGWKRLEGRLLGYRPPPRYQSLVVWIPKTRLLSSAWLKHGRIDEREVPRPRRYSATTSGADFTTSAFGSFAAIAADAARVEPRVAIAANRPISETVAETLVQACNQPSLSIAPPLGGPSVIASELSEPAMPSATPCS